MKDSAGFTVIACPCCTRWHGKDRERERETRNPKGQCLVGSQAYFLQTNTQAGSSDTYWNMSICHVPEDFVLLRPWRKMARAWLVSRSARKGSPPSLGRLFRPFMWSLFWQFLSQDEANTPCTTCILKPQNPKLQALNPLFENLQAPQAFSPSDSRTEEPKKELKAPCIWGALELRHCCRGSQRYPTPQTPFSMSCRALMAVLAQRSVLHVLRWHLPRFRGKLRPSSISASARYIMSLSR